MSEELNGSISPASQLYQLAARLHTAHADPDVWRQTLLAFRDCMQCHGVLDLARDAPALAPDLSLIHI